jgi:ribosome-associated protein
MNDEESPSDPPEPTIHLDQFLKTCGVATGGQAKRMIQGGEILVNGEIETRRRKQLRVGGEVALGDTVFVVAFNDE